MTYGFDALGRVSQVSTAKGAPSQVVVQNVAYHPFGGVKGFTLGNGQTYSRSYDQDGRIASYTLGASQFALAYDAASRIEIISDVGNPANSNTYGYDALDRLTQATLPSTPFAYAYDAVGNRVSKSVGSGTESYTYSTTSNRLATLTPTSGPTRTFGFDPNGSTVNDGLNSFVYDTRGRMVQAASAADTTAYQVNALGQRIRKTNSSTDTVFHYDSRGKLLAESDPGGATYARELLYLGDVPVAVDKGTLHFIHTDHLNTPRLVADAAGTAVWKWDQQEPFGVNVPDENPSGLGAFEFPLRFPGQYADNESGTYYNYFRDYDPATGRYLRSDPIGLQGGINSYVYVNGSPLISVDPRGLETTVMCRPVKDWRVGWLSVHCFVVVWHWEIKDCKKVKVVEKQYSVAGNPTPFPQGSQAPTYQDDKNAWDSGSGTSYDVPPPPGQSQSDFDKNVTTAGNQYDSGNGYDAKFGPNSNSATQEIIYRAGGTLPDIPGAFGQHYFGK